MLEFVDFDEGPALTEREREVLEWVASGRSTKQVAQIIGLTPRTVERHIEKLRHKLRARNKAHLVTIAIASGELEVDARRDRSLLINATTSEQSSSALFRQAWGGPDAPQRS